MQALLQNRAMVRFFKAFNNNPTALVRLLSLYVASEERSEISPLLSLSRGLPDCPLRAMVRRHLSDEGRHARLLRQRIAELGGGLLPIPAAFEPQEYHFQRGSSLAAVLSLSPDEASKPENILEILLFNSVLEEFALPRFMAHAEAAREADPRTYFMLMDIIPDEIRHVTYTQEQAYLIAGPELFEAARAKHAALRQAQARYGAHLFRLTIERLFDREQLGMTKLEYLAWRAVAWQQELAGAPVPPSIPMARPDLLISSPSPWGTGYGPEGATSLRVAG